MGPSLWFYQLLLSTLVLICLMIHVGWPNNPRATPRKPLKPAKPRRKRSEDSQPLTGLIHKPLCEACEQGADPRPQAPGAPPPVMVFTQGRRRTIDTQQHCCPEPDCSYHCWLGRGNIRAKGHPGGQPWRQLQCVSCHGYFSETHGTIGSVLKVETTASRRGLTTVNTEDCGRSRAASLHMWNTTCHSMTWVALPSPGPLRRCRKITFPN